MIKSLKYFGILVVTASMWVSCDSQADKALEEIRTAEAVLFTSKDKKVDPAKAKDMLAQYKHYIESYPESEAIPDLLFKSGELHMSLKQWLKATGAFHQITNSYPKWEKAPEAAFHIAYAFDLGYQEINSPKFLAFAKESYKQFIANYPNHKLAKDAQAAMDLLGMSDKEMIDKFRKQNK